MLFIAPVLSLSIRTTTDTSLEFDWHEILIVWRELLAYLAVFLLHNFLLAPLLVYKQKRWTYFALTAAIVVVFALFQCSHRPEGQPGHGPQPPMEQFDQPRPMAHSEGAPPPPPVNDRHDRPDDKRPPMMMGQHDIISTIVLILMLGMNIGVKLYFKSRHDQLQMAALERQNLERQLEYLRYQINPHFFMNTLNNIHALVDIDAEKSKHTILELSKMMRFVLYEGNKKMVPISQELEFLRSYISLMSLRYTDKVQITVELPTLNAQDAALTIPPLLFVTFVENAFKHGVTYQHESFIYVSISINDDTLSFLCRNSKREESEEEKKKPGGVGLRNIRERLDIIYGSSYKLNVSDGDKEYLVELEIPLNK
jgi:two-component sensor histidine kinase